jgi:ribosomal protein S18 acetylase RimI-like enzyme
VDYTLRVLGEVIIRRAVEGDVPRMAELAAELVRFHHAADPLRFMLLDSVEDGYSRWFGRELRRPGAILLVACRGDRIVGYAYGTLEERDWNMLLDAHGAVHDIFVDSADRRTGIGSMLVEAILKELESIGAPRIVLSTMVANHAAQRLFARHRFRPTMLEMTRETTTASHGKDQGGTTA